MSQTVGPTNLPIQHGHNLSIRVTEAASTQTSSLDVEMLGFYLLLVEIVLHVHSTFALPIGAGITHQKDITKKEE